jgi:hypothetical protein
MSAAGLPSRPGVYSLQNASGHRHPGGEGRRNPNRNATLVVRLLSTTFEDLSYEQQALK